MTATDQSSGCPNTVLSGNLPVSFSSPNATSINNGASEVAICSNTPASLIANFSGGVEYEWIKDGFTVAKNSEVLSATQPGKYSVRYKDSNGCWSPLSSIITVIQSAPISMSWVNAPTEVVKGSIVTFNVSTSPFASNYEWSYTSSNSDGIISISPIGNGSSAVVVFGNPTEQNTDIKITVKTVGHLCGDVTITHDMIVTDGCEKATSVNLLPNGVINIYEGG